MTAFPRLLADVGGTNVRFAMQTAPARIGPVTAYQVADFPSLEAAMAAYLAATVPSSAALAASGTGAQARPRHAAIGLANPITGDRVKLTNHDWAFSIEAMRRALDFDTLIAINDFTSLALALPLLPAEALAVLRPGQPMAGAPMALIGPGTGLGVSGLIPDRRGGAIALAGEGGHVEIMPHTDDEWIAWRAAEKEHDRVSAERLVSGMGLSHIHAALCAEMGTPLDSPWQAREITAAALQQNDPVARRAFAAFCGLLGSLAGDLALTLGARGGVYIGGGIVPRFVEAVAQSPFLERFVDKGRMQAYLEPVPVYVITDRYPAFPGLAQALKEALDAPPVSVAVSGPETRGA